MAVTPGGRANLGRFVEQVRKHPETKNLILPWLKENHPNLLVGEFIDRPQFALWLTAQARMEDSPITDTALGRLERGEGKDGPPNKVQIALIRSKLLKLPDGTPYTHDDLVAVLTEELNPFTGGNKDKTLNGSN